MIRMDVKPVKGEAVVKGKTLYECVFSSTRASAPESRNPFRVRAKDIPEAEAMCLVVFRANLAGKTLDFDVGDFLAEDGEKGEEGKEDGNGKTGDD